MSIQEVFDGGRRWVVALGVFVGLLAGFAAPGDLHVVVRIVVVAVVTAATMVVANLVRPIRRAPRSARR
jgi:hypothetical protein